MGSQSKLHRDGSKAPVVLAFAALAVLAGPVRGLLAEQTAPAMHLQMLAETAIESALGGLLLAAICLVRRTALPHEGQWRALLVLLLPQWLALPLAAPWIRDLTRGISWLYETPWAVQLLIGFAAPLWLALLAALQVVPEAVPRAVSGAAIAGIGAACLVIPLGAYSIALNQVPVVLIEVLLGILAVCTWAVAKPPLSRVPALSAAAGFLLLNAAGLAVLSLMRERSVWQPVDWHAAALPLALSALVSTVSWVLWFWLLQQMPLAAFCMRPLAIWTASLVPGFALFGFLNWRMDAALLISLAAMAVALRSRISDEQPLALGLTGP